MTFVVQTLRAPRAKPPGRTVLDLLADWPWCLVAEAALVLALWAAIRAPWATGRRAPGRQAS